MIVFLIVVSISTGYMQEWLKISVNNTIHLSEQTPGYGSLTWSQRLELHREQQKVVVYDYKSSLAEIKWLWHLDSSQLTKLKWFLALVLIFVHFLINRWAVQRINRRYLSYLNYIYAFSLLVIVLSLVCSRLTSLETYLFQRRVLGFVQSGVVIFFFLITEYIRLNVKDN